MIVYGDHSFDAAASLVAAKVAARIGPNAGDADAVRTALILAGQLEQGFADAGHPLSSRAEQLTDTLAALFLSAARGDPGPASSPRLTSALALAKHLAEAARDDRVEIRVPEGFAWYALYPDSYAAAADRWAERHACRSVLVIGLRSIGTTLSAVVAEALRARGMEVTRCTVRPAGHPFDRSCALPADLARAEHSLVVDEGPGLSGSSMAAVAAALAATGRAGDRIHFLPGHDNGPGAAASQGTRAWWTPDRITSVPWNQAPLGAETLGDSVVRMACGGEGCTDWRDIGAGGWRSICPPDDRQAQRYTAATFLERPKLLVTGMDGQRRLVRFAGLAALRNDLRTGAARERDSIDRLAERGLTPPVTGEGHGWLVIPWIDGHRVAPGDLNGDVLARMADVIAFSATPAGEARLQAAARLSAMVAANIPELLGENARRAAQAAGQLLERWPLFDWPSYGDGRLAPHEWVRTPNGRVVKTDAGGHTSDHTIVGTQPLAWDLAGAAVEWGLSDGAADALESLVRARIPVPRWPDPRLPACWRAAYAGFRAGVCTMAANTAGSGLDRSNFQRAAAAYSQRLAVELASFTEVV
jgi:hypothetical protein